MMAIFLIAVAGLVLQLLRLQVFSSDRYVAWGEDQRLRTEPLPGERGDIVDRNGEELAISLQAPVVYADPLLVSDPAGEAAALAPLLDLDEVDVHTRLASGGRFVYLQRPTTELVAEQVRALDLDGVFVGEEPERFHPNDESLARGLVGTVGVDNVGLSGIEAQYDQVLAGTPGRLVSEQGLNGRSIPEGERESLPAVDGADVRLTIDRALQFEVERALQERVAASGGKGGTVIISDPTTGEVLAMTSVAATEEGDVVTTSDNRSLTWTYEPASVMKAITFAAVLDQGIARPNSARTVHDTIELYEETFTDDLLYGSKIMSVTDILVQSSNTGTISWAQDLGQETFYDYLRDFGFGSPTGLDFPGESPGILEDVEGWPGTHIATIAIGQSIAVTPMQMLTAYNTIANDGVYVPPTLVSSVGTEGDAEGDGAESVDAKDARRVVRSKTANDVSAMLARVAAGGTATRAQVPGYSIAAKTGTARKVQESGGYRDAAGNFHYIATVAGFFPAEDPQLSMIVIIDEPSTEIYASRVAAPLFGELAAWALRHYRVSPAGDVVFSEGSDLAAIGADGTGDAD